jgi:hypothetical protein
MNTFKVKRFAVQILIAIMFGIAGQSSESPWYIWLPIGVMGFIGFDYYDKLILAKPEVETEESRPFFKSWFAK